MAPNLNQPASSSGLKKKPKPLSAERQTWYPGNMKLKGIEGYQNELERRRPKTGGEGALLKRHAERLVGGKRNASKDAGSRRRREGCTASKAAWGRYEVAISPTAGNEPGARHRTHLNAGAWKAVRGGQNTWKVVAGARMQLVEGQACRCWSPQTAPPGRTGEGVKGVEVGWVTRRLCWGERVMMRGEEDVWGKEGWSRHGRRVRKTSEQGYGNLTFVGVEIVREAAGALKRNVVHGWAKHMIQ